MNSRPSSLAHAGTINTYPTSIDGGFGIYYPVGEVSETNPSLSISTGNSFATYFAQSFVALPGLAQDMTLRMAPILGPDGVDFKVLIAETALGIDGTYTPTNIIYSSNLYTLGSLQGAYGTELIRTDGNVTVSLGGLDLIDGNTYSWVIDTVTAADGIEGYGGLGYRHPAQTNLPGNSSVLVWDLLLDMANQPWINVDYIDLAFILSFADGGIENPVHQSLGSLPTGFANLPPGCIPSNFTPPKCDDFNSAVVPLPAGVWLLLSAVSGLGLIGWRGNGPLRRRQHLAA